MAVELGAQIERDMGVDVPLMQVIQSGTINTLAARILNVKPGVGIDQLRSEPDDELLVPLFRLVGTHRRLVAIPYMAGGTDVFTALAIRLRDDIEVVAAQLPGHEGRLQSQAYGDLDLLVSALGKSMLRQIDRPYALYGHSLGALIAFELARWLRTAGARLPDHLFVAACKAPQLTGYFAPIQKDWPMDALNLASPAVLADLLRSAVPPTFLDNPAIFGRALPTIRTEVAMMVNYRYNAAPPLDCPITCLGGMQDQWLPAEALRPWQVQTSAAFRLAMLTGDHLFLRTQSNEIGRLIDEALRVTSSAPVVGIRARPPGVAAGFEQSRLEGPA
jgi:medium-chain acyl-[acyl-carrier-protein] hydrolase